jgi:RNA polymerase-binding transcription factor DksA
VSIDLEARKAELVELRARVLGAAEDVVRDEPTEPEPSFGNRHLADHASDLVERQLDESLYENAEVIVREIDDALARIEAGSYGMCAVCGKEIPEERLDAVPYATLCLEDKRAQERQS